MIFSNSPKQITKTRYALLHVLIVHRTNLLAARSNSETGPSSLNRDFNSIRKECAIPAYVYKITILEQVFPVFRSKKWILADFYLRRTLKRSLEILWILYKIGHEIFKIMILKRMQIALVE